MTLRGLFFSVLGLALCVQGSSADESLAKRLQSMPVDKILNHARHRGDAQAGGLVFFKSAAGCVKCHTSGAAATPLGPDLTTIGKDRTDEQIVEAILHPSKTIRKGYETVILSTVDGKVVTGLLVRETDEQFVLRDAQDLTRELIIEKSDVESRRTDTKSMMPEGLVATFRDERQFYNLVRYVLEVARGGPERAAKLQPDPNELQIVDDIQNLDHAGILSALGDKDFQAGKAIYLGHCQNCHGVDGNQPTLPMARAFGTQPLKYGADPYKMLLTLSRGNGMMAPMSHLSPKERYQVIHYIREALMKPRNPSYEELSAEYLSTLPKGEGQGDVVNTGDRDFGPVLGSQLGNRVNNALTFRLPNHVTASYDLHRMQLADVWIDGFLNLSQTQHYRQRGERMPQIDGQPIPGLDTWQWAFNGTFEIGSEVKPPRGPVRSDWFTYKGHYLHDQQAILSYNIHRRDILETLQSQRKGERVLLSHTLHVGAGEQDLKLCLGQLDSPLTPSGIVAIDNLTQPAQSGEVSGHMAVVTGLRTSRRNNPRSADQPTFANQAKHLLQGDKARQLDLGTPGRSVIVRFRTQGTGTLIASTPLQGRWEPNGKTLFIRGGRVVFDIGWVGAMTGKTDVADGKWHTAVLVVDESNTSLYVDGKLDAERAQFRRPPEAKHVLKIGATSTNFGGDFAGEIDFAQIIDKALPADAAKTCSQLNELSQQAVLFQWKPESLQGPKPITAEQPKSDTPAHPYVAAIVDGKIDTLQWEVEPSGRIVLTIPASSEPQVFRVVRGAGRGKKELNQFRDDARGYVKQNSLTDPASLTAGGPTRWLQELTVTGKLGESINGYALDTIPVPFENPWNAWLRTSAVDFFPDGRAVVTTHGGDVYLVTGIDAQLNRVTWKRFAAGLFEPFGVRVVNETIYVTCRDGIKRLHDFDNNYEADFIEAFWVDDDVSTMFHAYNFDLQTDSQGNFYFAKAGQYTQHHRPGTIMRVPPEGGKADVVAWGIRTPNGMGKLADDRFTVSDNQGPWMPAGKVSLIKPGSFLGNMPINKEQDSWLKEKHGGQLPETFDEPIIWTPQELDNSCGGQLWVADERFGPLSGRLLHSSYGKGWVYYMSLQEVDGQTQASIVPLPHQWDAGVMRMRTNPADGQVYGVGLSGWQGPAEGKDGCFQRLRYTGKPVRMIENVKVTAAGLELTFNFPVNAQSVTNPAAWEAEMWDYLWSRRYGSDQFSVRHPGKQGHDPLPVRKVEMKNDHTVQLILPDLAVCDQLSLQMEIQDAAGETFIEHVYLTIHAIPE